jgi:hypothetical protein
MMTTVIITIQKKNDIDVAMKCNNSVITMVRHVLKI